MTLQGVQDSAAGHERRAQLELNADDRNIHASSLPKTLQWVLYLTAAGIACAVLALECSMTPEQRIERLERPVVIP